MRQVKQQVKLSGTWQMETKFKNLCVLTLLLGSASLKETTDIFL